MHQDIYDPHLQYTILLGISRSSFKNWTPTPTSGSLNKKAIKNLLPTPLAPSVERPNVVDGTYGFSLMRHWYVWISDVTRVSVIVLLNLQVLLELNK